MAFAGQRLFNPANGLTTVFHKTAADTDGELLQIEWVAPPGWGAGPKHIHPRQEERFEVLEGELGSHVAGTEALHPVGDAVAAPPGAVHTVWNRGAGQLRLLVEFRPALRSEIVLEALPAIAQDGRAKGDGVPRNPLELALLVHDFEQEIYLATPPLALQRLLFGPLAALGRRLGGDIEERYLTPRRGDGPVAAAAGA